VSPGDGAWGFGLVVFDCDGVLVDSERLAVRAEAEVLTGLGWPISEAEVAERFVGRSVDDMLAEVARVLGHEVGWDAFETAHRAAFEAELAPVPGVLEVVESLAASGAAMCVASSSLRSSLAYKLERTGLARFFTDRVFSVEDVANGKPAPDVFLHAASTLGVPPAACAVIEDSPPGVAAGLAAGMTVFAFAGGLIPASRLARPDVTVFDDMASLPGLLDAAR
jgi:HAD superfamily hydrolase (TIGR01509 family)